MLQAQQAADQAVQQSILINQLLLEQNAIDTLHTVLRSIRSESNSGRDHRTVFREFLAHLGRIGKARALRALDPEIEVLVNRIRHKVERPYGVSQIETVRGVGYRLDPA